MLALQKAEKKAGMNAFFDFFSGEVKSLTEKKFSMKALLVKVLIGETPDMHDVLRRDISSVR